MLPKSIRGQLPLSYAGIALLTMAVLGGVLLTTLRHYYDQQEVEYLERNARTISRSLSPWVEDGQPQEALQTWMDGLAFLSQTRVRLFDAAGREILNTRSPQEFNVALSGAQPASRTVAVEATDPLPSDMLYISSAPAVVFGQAVALQDGSPLAVRMFAAADTPYGFDLSAQADPAVPRSTHRVRMPLEGAAGSVIGYVELSEGPAYGQQVVAEVARGWAVSGLVAVVLAAVAGWEVSRRLNAPLLALNGVTARMATGDLTARAGPASQEEFRTLARSFNRMADQVELTVGALRRFVADAAHEIHTPLTALHTQLELAPESAPVIAAREQVLRLERLTAGLLDLSRLEGGMGAARVRLDWAALLRELSEPYASQAEQAGQEFILEMPGRAVPVWADAGQLGRVFGNLVENALKFTPPGGSIRVTLRMGAGEGILQVSDTGIGIPAEDLPQLFSRFHRGRNTESYPGNGLGLAIVKTIVAGHGGQVAAEALNPGARFSVRLPLADDEGYITSAP